MDNLQQAFVALAAKDYPSLENPPSCSRRASVAVILRCADHDRSKGVGESLSVQNAEVLFIKRAERKGDRWTSHVAFPGGKREATDVSDASAAIRETMEEVGLDISEERCNRMLKLPERLITTSWTQIPLMVLCPFLFVLKDGSVSQLRLQESEVASAHWVPVSTLLTPTLRTRKRAAFSERMRISKNPVVRLLLQLFTGDMLFPAVQLLPSTSIFAIPRSLPPSYDPSSMMGINALVSYISRDVNPLRQVATDRTSPLVCWGITYGIIIEILQFLPSAQVTSPSYPTFGHWDLRFTIYLLTYAFRRGKKRELMRTAVEDVTTMTSPIAGHGPDSTVVRLLDGYYVHVRRAIVAAIAFRVLVLGGLCAWILHARKSVDQRGTTATQTIRHILRNLSPMVRLRLLSNKYS